MGGGAISPVGSGLGNGPLIDVSKAAMIQCHRPNVPVRSGSAAAPRAEQALSAAI